MKIHDDKILDEIWQTNIFQYFQPSDLAENVQLINKKFYDLLQNSWVVLCRQRNIRLQEEGSDDEEGFLSLSRSAKNELIFRTTRVCEASEFDNVSVAVIPKSKFPVSLLCSNFTTPFMTFGPLLPKFRYEIVVRLHVDKYRHMLVVILEDTQPNGTARTIFPQPGIYHWTHMDENSGWVTYRISAGSLRWQSSSESAASFFTKFKIRVLTFAPPVYLDYVRLRRLGVEKERPPVQIESKESSLSNSSLIIRAGEMYQSTGQWATVPRLLYPSPYINICETGYLRCHLFSEIAIMITLSNLNRGSYLITWHGISTLRSPRFFSSFEKDEEEPTPSSSNHEISFPVLSRQPAPKTVFLNQAFDPNIPIAMDDSLIVAGPEQMKSLLRFQVYVEAPLTEIFSLSDFLSTVILFDKNFFSLTIGVDEFKPSFCDNSYEALCEIPCGDFRVVWNLNPEKATSVVDLTTESIVLFRCSLSLPDSAATLLGLSSSVEKGELETVRIIPAPIVIDRPGSILSLRAPVLFEEVEINNEEGLRFSVKEEEEGHFISKDLTPGTYNVIVGKGRFVHHMPNFDCSVGIQQPFQRSQDSKDFLLWKIQSDVVMRQNIQVEENNTTVRIMLINKGGWLRDVHVACNKEHVAKVKT